MDPQYPQGSSEPQNVHELLNFYDQKASRGAPSKKSFLLLIGGAIALLLLIFFLFLGSRGNDNSATIESVLSAQQSILTTVDQSTKNIRGRTTLNFATRVNAVVVSDQSALLSSSTKKVSAKVYKNAKDAEGLAKIQQASVGNQFDDTLTSVLTDEIADYQTKLKSAYEKAKSSKVKAALSDAYTHSTNLKP